MRKAGNSVEEIERKRESGADVEEELKVRDWELQVQESGCRIETSRYNEVYRIIKVERIPRYMKGKGKAERIRTIARIRLGNKMRSGRYWETVEKRRCRLCGVEEEQWKLRWVL